MFRKWILGIIATAIAMSPSAQTLFTYGDHSVDAAEFIRAFNKNNQAIPSKKADAMKEYLTLYIHSKLKVQEAIARGYDTLPIIMQEIESLRQQIIENYLSDPKTEEKLLNEVFQRSLKDIRVAHIFISFKNSSGMTDTAGAQEKLKHILHRLQKGEDFLKVAQETSDDPMARTNKGEIGYITVFSLPYEFETAIYTTAPGKHSMAVRSKSGYHIFKNLGERKAVGKMKAQQILLALPPDADETTKKQLANKADSLYKRILAGEDFGKLASQFSNDYISAASSGNMPEFGVGKYDPVFETAVWSLQKDGAVTKPFLTSHGYHIVKRLGVAPVITDPKNKLNMLELRSRLVADSRWKKSNEAFYHYIISKTGYQEFLYNKEGFRAYADSLFHAKPLPSGNKNEITPQTALYKIGDSIFTVADFKSYAMTFGYNTDGSGLKPYPVILEESKEAVANKYYRNHLEKYHDEFRYQMNEFREGNLFFEIMQQEIWNRSQVDSALLMEIYQKNKSKYIWQPGADAVIFFCADENLCKSLRNDVKKSPSLWRELAESLGERVLADSARYESHHIPSATKVVFKPGMITEAVVNKEDNTASFAYILKVYPQPGQRSFEESRGLLINDYQAMLDEKWVDTLKKKYPVKINEEVLKTIIK
jgi:peptidyl-prolyl cis-trans isomerase SurA